LLSFFPLIIGWNKTRDSKTSQRNRSFPCIMYITVLLLLLRPDDESIEIKAAMHCVLFAECGTCCKLPTRKQKREVGFQRPSPCLPLLPASRMPLVSFRYTVWMSLPARGLEKFKINGAAVVCFDFRHASTQVYVSLQMISSHNNSGQKGHSSDSM
jgi:hypothetical protein